ncbi:MAG: AAA family ATPase [Myxococcota bacterium]
MAIARFTARDHLNLGAVDLAFGPFTVLVGPNGIGKSTVLRALRALANDAHPQTGAQVLAIQDPDGDRRIELTGPRPVVSHLRLDPSALETPSAFPPDASPGERGQCLAGAVSRLILERPEVMERIRLDLAEVVPRFVAVRSRPLDGRFELRFDFSHARDVPQARVSTGTLAALAVLVVAHAEVERAAMLTLDDPETGLHPDAQQELVRKLRALTGTGRTQIVVATHSPYVVDAADAENVWVLGRRDDGRAVSRRLTDHPDAARSGRVLTAGELWGAFGEDWVGQPS